jgi:CBS domain-containing protein
MLTDHAFTANEPETIGTFVSEKAYLSVPPDCPVETILNIMSHSGKRVAGVVDPDRTLLGFLTRSNIFGKLVIEPGFDVGTGIQTRAIKSMTAADVMIHHPAFLASELDIRDALSIMGEYGYQYMPVLSDYARLVGIADLRDLALIEQDHNRRIVEHKNNLLSHLMHHGTYGLNPAINAR